MTHMRITSYFNGKTVYRKLNEKASGKSLTYQAENGRIVIRDYFTGKKLQTMKCPGSCSFEAVYKD